MNRCEAILTTRNMTFPRIEGEFFRVIQPLTKTRNIMFIEEPNVNGHEENHTINSFRILQAIINWHTFEDFSFSKNYNFRTMITVLLGFY